MTGVQCIRSLKDVEGMIQEKAMSGETSSPADGGHLRRGLPPSAALRWNHYRFVSPLHSKFPPPQWERVILFLVLCGMYLTPFAHAEFSYQNPARSALDEIRSQSPRQLQTSNSQQRELVKKQQAITETIQIQKEMESNSKQMKKSLEDEKNRRQNAERNTTELSKKATEQTQRVRAKRDLGFEYFRHENGMLELYQDGLVGATLNEPVDEVNEDGKVVGQTRRDTVDIEYFKRGPYHRMRKHFKMISWKSWGEVQVTEQDILRYVPGSVWYGSSDSHKTRNIQMPMEYLEKSWSSREPYQEEVRIVTDIRYNSDRLPLRWLEAKGATNQAPVTLTFFDLAEYNSDDHQLNYYQSLQWSSQLPEMATWTEWQGSYQLGILMKEASNTVNFVNEFSILPEMLAEPLFTELNFQLEQARKEIKEDPLIQEIIKETAPGDILGQSLSDSSALIQGSSAQNSSLEELGPFFEEQITSFFWRMVEDPLWAWGFSPTLELLTGVIPHEE